MEATRKTETTAQATNHNRLTKTKYGVLLHNKFDRFIGRSIELYGEYSEEEITLFKQICKPGDIVVEVGANIGAHTLPLARLVGPSGHIYAFEPQRLVFQTLCANMALNSITNASCFNCGVGADESTLKIKELDYNSPANFGGYTISPVKSGTHLPIIKLDNKLANKNIRLLKIDVEGMEKEVLIGAEQLINDCQPLIYLENDRKDKSKALIEYLWSKEYQLYWHKPRLYSPYNFNNNPDNIFGNIVSVNMLAIPKTLTTEVNGMQMVESSTYHPMANRANSSAPDQK